ncbi:MAG: hypothetical protein IKD89_00215 [Clostridia bacterium]|nr:hypothetical protein [Clostridia bacterium]
MRRIILILLVFMISAGIIFTGCSKSEEEVAAEEAFNTEATRIQSELETVNDSINKAQAIVDDERPALDPELKPALQTVIADASAIEFQIPEKLKGVDEFTAAT